MTDENTFESGGMKTAENELERGQRQAQRAARDLKSAGTAMADDYRDKAEKAWGNAKTQARTWQADGEDYVRENPIKAVLTMLGVGFVLGMIFKR